MQMKKSSLSIKLFLKNLKINDKSLNINHILKAPYFVEYGAFTLSLKLISDSF